MKKTLICSVLLCAVLLTGGTPSLFALKKAIADSSAPNPQSRLYQNQVEPASSVLKKRGLLLFFLNPNGRPCQLQEQIINSNRAEIEKRFKIRPVMTTVQADRMFFYQFGVRRLPTIILLNNDGTVFQQLPPGIRSGNQLMKVIEQYR